MKKVFLSMIIVGCFAGLYSCFTNPVTGRKSLNLVEESDIRTQATAEYQKFLAVNKPMSGAEAEMVKRVGQRIAAAADQYLRSKGKESLISGYQWEYNLVANGQVNAWCMPGGKVVVYSGILPVTQNETGLAVVMGHEIAHAIARHSNERASQMLVAEYGGQALSALSGSNPTAAAKVFNAAVGVGGYGILLKFSRTQESEADEMGLYMMAMAGYDPAEAVTFWQRMSAQGNNKGWELASTHPSDQTRIADIQRLLPMAKQYYKPQ